MESVIVNARVSRAKKEAGAGILASLGSTTTELINGAYDYLIEHRSLPGASAESAPSGGKAGVARLRGLPDRSSCREGACRLCDHARREGLLAVFSSSDFPCRMA